LPTQAAPQGNSLLSMQHDQFNQPLYPPTSPLMEETWKNGQPFDIPTIDTGRASVPGSPYGSPQNDGMMARSPNNKTLNIMDVALPASFDSQGVSIYARHGPVAASVPTRFGLPSSPPSSSMSGGHPHESSALRNLSSAFGDAASANGHPLGSSPSVAERIRPMHSERGISRPRMMSSSVGTKRYLRDASADADDDWDFNPMFEDAVPSTLNELLTPQERLRRLSRSADDENMSNHRAALSGLGTPLGESPKVGSPGALGQSPSRFGQLFARQQRDKSEATLAEANTNAFGHVGSPFRSSLLHPGASPSLRASSSRPTSGEFSISSPPRQASILSKELQRVRISSRESTESQSNGASTTLQPAGSSSSRSASGSGIVPNRLDRVVSTNSSIGVGRDKIDEEPEDLFPIEEINSGWKRPGNNSNVWGNALGSVFGAAIKTPGVFGKRSGPGNGI
jgi:hypothetical protein